MHTCVRRIQAWQFSFLLFISFILQTILITYYVLDNTWSNYWTCSINLDDYSTCSSLHLLGWSGEGCSRVLMVKSTAAVLRVLHIPEFWSFFLERNKDTSTLFQEGFFKTLLLFVVLIWDLSKEASLAEIFHYLNYFLKVAYKIKKKIFWFTFNDNHGIVPNFTRTGKDVPKVVKWRKLDQEIFAFY